MLQEESEDLYAEESPEHVECSVDYHPEQFDAENTEQHEISPAYDTDPAMNRDKRKKKNCSFSERRMVESNKTSDSLIKRDECSVYGEYVANELRNLSTQAQTLAKHNINNILFEANMGNYDLPSANELFAVGKTEV